MKDFMKSEGLKMKRKKFGSTDKREVTVKPHKSSKQSKPTFGNALARAALKKFLKLDVEDWK